MRVEIERMYLYPLSDEEIRLVIEKESVKVITEWALSQDGVKRGGRNRCGKYSLTESPFPDRLYKKWKVGRRGTKICIRR